MLVSDVCVVVQTARFVVIAIVHWATFSRVMLILHIARLDDIMIPFTFHASRKGTKDPHVHICQFPEHGYRIGLDWLL